MPSSTRNARTARSRARTAHSANADDHGTLHADALPTVLLTGFDPFGDDRHRPEPINPSWLAVARLQDEIIVGHRVASVQLPTSFARAPRALSAAIRRHRPALVLCVGQAGGRRGLSLERVAINLMDARIPDNDGAQPVDAKIARGGPAAYFSTLPLKAMHAAVDAAGLPVELSQTAGTFVCNQVFYVLMRHLARLPAPRPRGGFMHVPFVAEQVEYTAISPAPPPGVGVAAVSDTPWMTLDDIVSGLRIAVQAALRTHTDVRAVGGATH